MRTSRATAAWLVATIALLVASAAAGAARDCTTVLEYLEKTPRYSRMYEAVMKTENKKIRERLGSSKHSFTFFLVDNGDFKALAEQLGMRTGELIKKLSTGFTASGKESKNYGPVGTEVTTLDAWVQAMILTDEVALDEMRRGKSFESEWTAACCETADPDLVGDALIARLIEGNQAPFDDWSLPKQYTVDVSGAFAKRVRLSTESANATLIKDDSGIAACSAVMHEVDGFMPPLPLPLPDGECISIYEFVEARPDMSSVKAIFDSFEVSNNSKISKLSKSVRNPMTSVTAFLPTDEAFDAFATRMGVSSVDNLLRSDASMVEDTLIFHMLSSPAVSGSFNMFVQELLSTVYSAVNKDNIDLYAGFGNVTTDPSVPFGVAVRTCRCDTCCPEQGDLQLQSANLIETDIQACASIINVVDAVLEMPK